MSKAWKKVPISILDDRDIVNLPDDQWRAYIENLPNHYDAPVERLSWLKVKRTTAPQVFARDEHVCKYCGTTERLEIDHIIPLSKGGTNDLDNLQILCRRCNSIKRDKI